MATPYIWVTGTAGCFGRHGHPRDPEDCPQGFHAFFYTYVPFVPTFLSADFTRMISGEASRIKLVVMRQIRFLNDLNNCKTGAAETFDLRFVSDPRPGQPFNDITIFFVGKAFGTTAAEARGNAVRLWRTFTSHFPLEEPFNYPLGVVWEQPDGGLSPQDAARLELARDPFPGWDPFASNLIEIRKYEDRDPLLAEAGAGQPGQPVGYYPHPFRPTLDFSAMGRFLETFGRQSQRCVASISLRPTTLAQGEQMEINQMLSHYARLVAAAAEAQNWLAPYRAERLQDIQRTFEPLINQRNHLFLVKIQVIGEHEAPAEVVAALGSEIMNNATPEPRRWAEVRPRTAQEAVIAFDNFRLAEFQPWPKVVGAPEPLWRLASLVTSYEAVGAFRLPIPPESGHMPGISVRDEPFVMPADTLDQPATGAAQEAVPLGKILHRGTVTSTDYLLPLAHLKRHGLIAGSTGTGKTNTCLHLLTELWQRAGIAFLVVYPIDKPDYRILAADPAVRDRLLIYTLGDDNTSPFRFNPFAVPPGILVRTHISLLMRAFSAAFSMWDPLPAVYRAALRRTYEDAGFGDLRTARGGDPGTRAPLLSRFYEVLVETAEDMTRDYGREAKGNIRQGSEIRIRDLLLNAGHVLNVREAAPWDVILEHPTVMEIARVGSVEDGALMMGFLLMSLTSHLASRLMRGGQPRQHVTLIEEAHRLMAAHGGGGGEGQADARAKASEDFANILAEIRGFNESILIAEQTPTELVTGAIANTYVKITHWLEEQRSFDLFANIMNLNAQQRDFFRTLPQGCAVVRGASGRPLLVQVANYLDQFQHADDSPVLDVSDAAVAAFMRQQTARLGLAPPEPTPYQVERASAPGAAPRQDAGWLLTLPMQTCALCPALAATHECRWGSHVRGKLVVQGDPNFLAFCDRHVREFFAGTRASLEPLPAQFATRYAGLRGAVQDAPAQILYCYLAHRADDALHGALTADAAQAGELRTRALAMLRLAGVRRAEGDGPHGD